MQKLLFHQTILVIFGDLLIYHWLTEVELDLSRSQELIILPAIAGNPRAIALVQTREARQTTRAIF